MRHDIWYHLADAFGGLILIFGMGILIFIAAKFGLRSTR